ncbi:acyl-CoA dehydrogenase [Paraburkholderia sp. CNPSo 3272]|uniref:acyl-CoA dehydrogenase family protein n=1 Tax=Paraburkholderia sp. CNPSo 3272 TaxID=2940931 RepID=UPI0020B6D3A1|nr:acyl-CoA dehydrogenase family protein [Paraburkholderia sp. CNPSo 3272]MCP3725590.1 acyl-CoA dehydrogenase [Paraburkholderia sp. CNPSo 3272]
MSDLPTHWQAELHALMASESMPLDAATLAGATARLVAAFPVLPTPGAADTLARWQFLAEVAARDLSLVKIYEAHADARAILAELAPATRLEAPSLAGQPVWAVWAARSPGNELSFASRDGRHVKLAGTKAWCSGARFVTHALVTCVDTDGSDWLAAVSLDQPGVTVSARGWEAVGMDATQSVEVDFSDARATLVGNAGAYVRRPGFWHGGAGIAACWYGAASALAARLRDAAQRRDNPHLRAHLGAADVALAGARACLRECASTIDAAPLADAMRHALRARCAVESAVDSTLRACARGMGAAPLCRDRWFARMSADLPVFVRQSHAEADLAALAGAVLESGEDWRL